MIECNINSFKIQQLNSEGGTMFLYWMLRYPVRFWLGFGLFVFLTYLQMNHFVYEPERQHQLALEQKADLAVRHVYMGQPQDFADLSAGDYTVDIEVRNGFYVVRQIVPTGDIDQFISNIPENIRPGMTFTVG